MAELPIEIRINDHEGPEKFIYKHLHHKSGPSSKSGNSYDMNTNSSLNTPSIFDYEIPGGMVVDLARCNFILTGWGSIHPNNFAGISDGLENGCLFQIVDSDGVTLLDFNDEVPLKSNDQFAKLAGVDSVAVDVGDGDDWLPIRFTIQKAGKKMRLVGGQSVRWTNRDDLSSIKRFQFMVQGVIVDT